MINIHRCRGVWLAAALLLPVAMGASPEQETVVIHADVAQAAPDWALLERHLIEAMNRAGKEFVKTYALPDGSLRWKERYEGGMNSSDDAYEAFRGYSLHYILGGSRELDTLHRHVWEGITRQFSRYGQIYREFDSNWDWMHHGEGYVSLYPMGMADPTDEKFRDRAVKFAAMYIGEDPEAPNYNPELKLMRASMNGSRGPKMEWRKRDWIPTNANLVYYQLPFDDIPGVESSTGWINDHPENDQFALIVKAMSDHMAKGDVPINLTATPLIANAFLYTGAEKYRRWVTDYLGKWIELTNENGGITPDNVGLSGKIGEYNDGNWWGGYYGWKWVRGGTDIVLATLTAAKVAFLLTGEKHWFDLPRSQMSVMRRQGKVVDGVPRVPIRFDSSNGWYHFVRESSGPYVQLWQMSQAEQDWKQVERLAEARKARGTLRDADLRWAYFVKGRNPGYPEEAFRDDLRYINTKMDHILNEHGDPETWFDAKWLALDPMPTDNLVRLTIGGVPVHKRGEMLHARLRYFDAEKREPGLPQGVSALVTGLTEDIVEVDLVNTNLFDSRQVIVQAGAYGEDEIEEVTYRRARGVRPPVQRSAPAAADETVAVQAATLQVNMDPGAGTHLRIRVRRHAHTPSYEFPWRRISSIR